MMMHFTEHQERLMREVRSYLRFAHQQEVSGNIEYADAAGAVAANKLARVVRISDNVVSINERRKA